VRALTSLALLGIQQSVPGSLLVSLVVTGAAALAGFWAIAALRR
jgi:hypothetical protein